MDANIAKEWRKIVELRPEILQELGEETLRFAAQLPPIANSEHTRKIREEIERLLEEKINTDTQEELLNEIISFHLDNVDTV